MAASITTNHLTKYFGKAETPALNGLSLAVQAGEIYGFLGANGAGKSTTIRLLLNFLRPSSGTAQIMGLDSISDSVEAKRHIGYLAGEVALYQKPTARQLLDYMSSLQPAKAYRSILEKRFEADLDKPISTLSKGNRQKIGIIQAFMHQPDVLILDEPTSGLDPLMQEAFYQTLQENRQRGAAIFMSSHNLAEAQRVCDRIGIIKHGRLIREQSIHDDNDLATVTFRVTFARPADLKHCLKAAGLKLVSRQDGQTAIFKPAGTIAAALAIFGHYDIQAFNTQALDLEDEFLEFYGDKA